MPSTMNQMQARPVLMLPAVLDLTESASLKRSLQDSLVRGEGLAVNARHVSRVSSPCLQVLAAATRAFTASGGPGLRIEAASDAFRDTVSALGLAPLFGLQESNRE